MALKIRHPGGRTGEGDEVMGVTEDRISWGAIFAGAACALALQIVFTLMTAGLGLDLVKDGDASGAGWASGLFFAVTAIASMFAGGWIAGRLCGVPFMPSAVLHGVVVWALVMLGVTWLSVSATGTVLRGATEVVSTAGSAVGAVAGGAAQAVGGAVSAAAPGTDQFQMPELDALIPPSIERDLEQALGTQNLSPAQIRREAQALAGRIIDQRDIDQARRIAVEAGRQVLRNPGEAGAILQQAVDAMTQPQGPLGEQQFDELQGVLQQRYGISEAQSAEFVERWRAEFVEARDQAVQAFQQTAQTVADELNDAAAAAADAAQAAADAAASAAWWTAIGGFLALLAGAIGAAVGRPEDITHEVTPGM